MPIIKPFNFDNYDTIEIQYYRSLIYPSITFREYKKGKIETKEIIEKIKTNYYNIVLSCEQSYNRKVLRLIMY